jgi:hypothetical protein
MPSTAKFVTEKVFKIETQAIRGEIKVLHIKIDKIDHKLNSSIEWTGQRFEQVDRRFEQMDQKFERLEQKLDSSVERLDGKIDRVALSLLKTQADVEEIKNTMATKSDIDRVINLVADFSKKTDLALQNQDIHRGYIHDHEARLIALERRAAL